MKYYPVFLNLNKRNAVVVGGGKVAERKVLTLIRAGAAVEVISPKLTGRLEKFKKKGLLTHRKRNYKKGDVNDAFLVIAGTSSSRTNARIAREAGKLINVIDTPAEGNFIAPSVVTRGPLTIAISTEGAIPAAARTIRKQIEELYGPEFTRYLTFLKGIRKKAMKRITDSKKRERFLREVASSETFDNLRKKGAASLTRQITNYLENKY